MEGTEWSLSQEVEVLQSSLAKQFQEGNWREVSSTLHTLAKIGELEGQAQLSLRAQSLREILGVQAGGRARTEPGSRLEELYTDLMFHVSHLVWRSRAGTS